MNIQKAFDKIQQSTLEVLSKPGVIDALGEKAVLYADLMQNAFLPDIYEGSLHLPADQLLEDNIAVVPIKKSKGSTPKMQYFLQWPRFEDFSQTQNSGQLAYLGLYRYIHLVKEKERSSFKNAVAMAVVDSTDIQIKDQPDSAQSYFHRPVVFIDSKVSQLSEPVIASDIVHELCHIDMAKQDFADSHKYNQLSETYTERTARLAIHEKKAYMVGYKILKACGIESIDLAKRDVNEIFTRYKGKDAQEGINEYRRFILRNLTRYDRMRYSKPMFKDIPYEAISVAVNESFGTENQPITDTEIAAYDSLRIMRAKTSTKVLSTT